MSDFGQTIDKLSERFDARLEQRKPAYSGGSPMPYISHGLCTKRLNTVCPDWSSRLLGREIVTLPIARYDKEARGKIAKNVTWVEITVELTIGGVSRQEVGVAELVNDYGTAAKAAASDGLKRAAMRFGVALYLWESLEEQDGDESGIRLYYEGDKHDPPEHLLDRPQAAPRPRAAAPQRPPERARDLSPVANLGPDATWNDLWPWLKKHGINSRPEIDALVGKSTGDWSPGEIYVAVEIKLKGVDS